MTGLGKPSVRCHLWSVRVERPYRRQSWLVLMYVSKLIVNHLMTKFLINTCRASLGLSEELKG